MTTKLVSANMGIILVVEQDGEEKTIQLSITCPSESAPQPVQAIREILELINETFGTQLFVKADGYKKEDWNVPIAKPKRIKAPRRVSQNEFNKRIKELGYKP